MLVNDPESDLKNLAFVLTDVRLECMHHDSQVINTRVEYLKWIEVKHFFKGKEKKTLQVKQNRTSQLFYFLAMKKLLPELSSSSVNIAVICWRCSSWLKCSLQSCQLSISQWACCTWNNNTKVVTVWKSTAFPVNVRNIHALQIE